MPRRERLHNNTLTTLTDTGGINDTDTTLNIASAADWPSDGDFRIIVNEEIMLVTAISGTTLTVVRGQDDTDAAAQSEGAAVRIILTAGALNQWADDMVPGYSDRNPHRLLDDTGATLDSTDFSWFEQQPGTVDNISSITDETWGGMTLNIGHNNTENQLTGMTKSQTAGAWKFTAHIQFGLGYKLWDDSKGTTFGICARD